MANKKSKVIAAMTIFPVGVGSSVGDYVRAAFKSMKSIKGVKLQPNAMSTVIEADSLQGVFSATDIAHKTILKMGAKRVYIVLTIDHRLDKLETASYKLNRIKGKIV
jgi:uncharacterized protein (TIGR00106 family)